MGEVWSLVDDMCPGSRRIEVHVHGGSSKLRTYVPVGKFRREFQALIDRCVEEVRDKLLVNPPIVIYGKPAKQRRSVGFFADAGIEGYKYSGQTALSQPLGDALRELLETVNDHFESTFNGILVNYYKDGSEYISKHSDDEKALADIGVLAISVGQERIFRIRNKKHGDIVKDIPMKNLDVILMSGTFQKDFTHEVPPQTKLVGPKAFRYSFTFRQHDEVEGVDEEEDF